MIRIVELREIHRDAACPADVLDALLEQREHAEAEEVDLHEPHRLDVVLVPRDDGALVHRRGLDGDDRGERLLGEDEAADVNRAVTRDLVQPGDDARERADARIVGVEPRVGEERRDSAIGTRHSATVVRRVPSAESRVPGARRAVGLIGGAGLGAVGAGERAVLARGGELLGAGEFRHGGIRHRAFGMRVVGTETLC